MDVIEGIRRKIQDNEFEFSRHAVDRMTLPMEQENLVEQKVTYTLLKAGKFYIIENVPARVNIDTGEQLFSPQTVEQLQRLIQESPEPSRIIETPVYEFAA